MKKLLIPLGIALAAAASGAWAKAPADATGECKDGSYTTSASKEGACSSHGGVKKWMAKEEKSSSAKSSKSAAASSMSEKPANATGECKDGTFTDSASKSGACSGHKGVKSWYGAKDGAASDASSSKGTSMSSKSSSSATPKSTTASAAGGGHGKVWVNTDSKVYHCESDALYGKTKQGEYMSESQAKASGARAARGKECA